VNFGTEWRRILKSVVISHVEFLEEISHVEWSCLCALANDAPASLLLEIYQLAKEGIAPCILIVCYHFFHENFPSDE
jgi:hypothetical protein